MSAQQVKVGDTVDLKSKASNMVRLPDGSVVTTRGSYTARHVGEHVVFATKQAKGKPPETVDVQRFTVAAADGGDFDPSEHSVEEVNAYLEDHAVNTPGEIARVLELEEAGKGRKGILEGPHATEDDS